MPTHSAEFSDIFHTMKYAQENKQRQLRSVIYLGRVLVGNMKNLILGMLVITFQNTWSKQMFKLTIDELTAPGTRNQILKFAL